MAKLKIKKILRLGATYALVAALSIGGTMAYLQDDDSDVNVMTLGNVKIKQHEYQRVIDDSGNYKTDKIDDRTSYVLEEFKQDKALLPVIVNPSISGWDAIPVRMSQVDSYGGMDVFATSNAQDKFVTVENTGRTDAYVRTLVAIEIGDTDGSLIATSYHKTWTQNAIGEVEIEGNNYYLYEYIYAGGQLSDGSWRHENGILPAGDTSYPNLAQVYLMSEATNEDCEAIDGNGNGKLDIIVLSQAVQAAGFENAQIALDTAFGDISDTQDGLVVAAEGLAKAIDDAAADEWDTWDGTSDTTWYNDTDTEFTLTTAEHLAGLAELVDGGNTFAGKTIKMGKNFDLKYVPEGAEEPMSFEPAGSSAFETVFSGIFDGQDHTILNMNQNGWELENGVWDGDDYGLGLFGSVENATIRNLKIDNAFLHTEANLNGFIAGTAYGECVFEDITIDNSYSGNHSWYSGGIVGWASGDHKYINCDIDDTNVISSQWGDFNNANGGIIGGVDPEATIYMEECDVACRIDAYNDVTSAYEWYSYRSCGMLIGDTGQKDDPDGDNVGNAIAPNLTCKNVRVTYGNWANYHYCEFNSAGYPYCRVEAGESTSAYGNARVGEYIDANGNKVVDDNHVHNDGEKHNELIAFDQLYGGESGDRYCTYGTAIHDGVTVIYNNK